MVADFAVMTIFKSKDEVSKNFNRMGKNAGLFGRKTSKAFGRASKSASAFGAVTKGILAAGAVTKGLSLLSTGLSTVSTEFIAFDSAITQASAKFTDLNLSTEKGQAKLLELKNTAREVGATTKFSAAQAAAGLDFYATAGFNAAQAMAVLAPTARLAMAANTDLARVSDIASDSIGIFGLQSKDSTKLQANFIKMSDQMAFTMTSTNTNMEALFETIKGGGTIFTQSGQSMATFNAIAGTLAARGIKGEKAGIAMRTMMTSLAKATPEAQEALELLGVRTVDQGGNFRDVLDIMKDMRGGLGELGDAQQLAALKTIFGKQALSAAQTVLQKTDKDLRSYRKSIEDSSGATQKMADIMSQSLENRLLSLKSAAIDVGFQLFTAFGDTGANAVDSFTKIVRTIDLAPFINIIKRVTKFSGVMFKEFVAFGDRTGLFDAISEGLTALKPAFNTILDITKTPFKFFDNIGVFDAMVIALKIVIATITTMTEIFTLLWKNVIKPIIGGITSAVDLAKSITSIGGLSSGEERNQRDQSTRDVIAEQRAANLAERRARRAPNQTQLESRATINGNIDLNIAGAPEGTTAAASGASSPNINVNMLEFAMP